MKAAAHISDLKSWFLVSRSFLRTGLDNVLRLWAVGDIGQGSVHDAVVDGKEDRHAGVEHQVKEAVFACDENTQREVGRRGEERRGEVR